MHSKDLKDILITIAIKELLANNWNKIDIKFLSNKAKISLEEVSQICGSKKDLLDFYMGEEIKDQYKLIEKDINEL